MPTISDEDANFLKKLRTMVDKNNRGPKLTGGADTERRLNSLMENIKDMDNSFGGLTKQFKSIISESYGLNRVLKGMHGAIEDNIESLDAESKQVARDVEEQLKARKVNISQIQETSKALNEYKTALVKFKAAQEEFVKKDKELSNARAREQSAKGHHARKVESANVKRTMEAREKSKRGFSEAMKDFQASMGKLDDKKLGIAGLDRKTIQLATDFENLGEQTKAQNATLKALEGRENALHIVSNAGITSMNNFVTGIKGKLAALPMQLVAALARGALLAGKQVFSDVQANARFYTSGLHLLQNPMLGISQSERAQIVGTNRTNLRLLGNGSAENGIGQMGITSAAQTASRQFGIINPAEAMQFFLQNQQLSMMMGSSGTIKATTENMNAMSNMRKVVGVTTDELNDFYQSMVQGGLLTQRAAQLSNLDDKRRTQVLDSELKRRLELNKVMGISTDLYKQQVARRSAKQMHTGIGDFFKNVIMGQIGLQTMGIAPNQDTQKLLELAAEGDQNASVTLRSMSSVRQAQIANKNLKVMHNPNSTPEQVRAAEMAMNLPAEFIGRSDLLSGGNVSEGNKQINQSYAQFRKLTGSTMSQQEFVQTKLLPLIKQSGLNPNTKVPDWAQPLFNNKANQNIGDEQTEKTSSALGTLTNRAFEAARALHGIKGSPIGQLLSGAGSVLIGGAALKISGKVGGALLKRYIGGTIAKTAEKKVAEKAVEKVAVKSALKSFAGRTRTRFAASGALKANLLADAVLTGITVGDLSNTLFPNSPMAKTGNFLSNSVFDFFHGNGRESDMVGNSMNMYMPATSKYMSNSDRLRRTIEEMQADKDNGAKYVDVMGKKVAIGDYLGQLLQALAAIDKNTDKTADASKQQLDAIHGKDVAAKLARYGNMRQNILDSVVNKLGSV